MFEMINRTSRLCLCGALIGMAIPVIVLDVETTGKLVGGGIGFITALGLMA